jgi:hypothetical protein
MKACVGHFRRSASENERPRRTADGWQSQVLHAADELAVPEFGLICLVRDVYRDTPLG